MTNGKAIFRVAKVFSTFWQWGNTLTAAGCCLFYRQGQILVYGLFPTFGKLT